MSSNFQIQQKGCNLCPACALMGCFKALQCTAQPCESIAQQTLNTAHPEANPEMEPSNPAAPTTIHTMDRHLSTVPSGRQKGDRHVTAAVTEEFHTTSVIQTIPVVSVVINAANGRGFLPEKFWRGGWPLFSLKIQVGGCKTPLWKISRPQCKWRKRTIDRRAGRLLAAAAAQPNKDPALPAKWNPRGNLKGCFRPPRPPLKRCRPLCGLPCF